MKNLFIHKSEKKIEINLLRIVVVLFLMSGMLACQNDTKEKMETKGAGSVLDEDPAIEATGFSTRLQIPYFYNFEPDSNATTLSRNEYFDSQYLNLDTLVKAFNVFYPEIQLSFDKQSGDTVFMQIRDAMYLTQQMGSEGAHAYLSEVVFGFTELPHVNYVNFKFTEGDHAVPGTYDRQRISK